MIEVQALGSGCSLVLPLLSSPAPPCSLLNLVLPDDGLDSHWAFVARVRAAPGAAAASRRRQASACWPDLDIKRLAGAVTARQLAQLAGLVSLRVSLYNAAARPDVQAPAAAASAAKYLRANTWGHSAFFAELNTPGSARSAVIILFLTCRVLS